MNEREQFEKAIQTADKCNRPNSSDYFIGDFNLTVFAECLAQQAQEPVAWVSEASLQTLEAGGDVIAGAKSNLRAHALFTTPPSEAARIAQLEEEVAEMIKEQKGMNANYSAIFHRKRKQIKELEAKLAVAEDALSKISKYGCDTSTSYSCELADEALKAIADKG